MQGSTLAVWEVMFLVRSYKGNAAAVAKHLRWPEAKVRAAVNYAEAFPKEIDEATAENDSADFEMLKRMLPQAHCSRSAQKKGGDTGGVVFVNEKTISPADIGGLVRALFQVFKETGKWDWIDRVYFLGRQP